MWKLKVLILSIISLSVSANRINKDEKLGQVEISEILSYRLPKNTIPKSYDLTIETKIHENNFDFSGNVKIHVEIVEPTDSITLHSRQLKIDKIDLLLPNSFPITIDAEFHHIESHDFLIIKLPKVYNASDELILDISYLGNLRDDNAGFYRSSYYNNDSIKWYAATQFQMDDARHALPCFDEPGFRATMKVTLRHGKALHAISNTEIVEVIPDGDYTVTKFKETPVMPTYLLAFIVTDFGHIIANDSRVPQKIYGGSELIQNGELEIAAGVVGKILDIFESFLPDYPLNKIDHVAVHYPKKVAMENFGLITYDEYLLSLNPISPEKKYSDSINHIVQSISNTLSMQWFGNTVSPKWWQYLWLSEGFAKFFEGYIQYLYYNDRSLIDKHFRSIIYESFSLDSWTDRTMNDYVEHPNELWTKFSSISSIKSACVLRMFMEAITEDVFIKGLNYYLTDNFMQSVTPAELHASLQKAYNEVNAGNPLHIDTIMNSWEDQAGYPLISVSISGSNLIVSQRKHHANTGETYTVPLTFATKSYPIFTTRTKTWLPLIAMPLQQASIGFAPGDWIILNINQVGYYKVDYDKTLWHAIIDQLKEDPKVINSINREVLQDEFMMAWMELERVNGGDALSFISYLQKESNPAVWNQAYELLRYLRSNLFGTAVYDEFLKLLQQITKPHLQRLGYEASTNDTSDDTQLRSITKEWNCIAIDGDCVSRDLVQLILFRMNIEAGNFNFCNALKIADRTTYFEILSKVITDSNFDSRNEYIWGLGCSMISQNLESLLNAVLDTNNELENFERETILNVMASTTNIGLEMSLNFIDEHYMEMSELLQYSTMPIIYFANNAKEEKMMDQIENLIVKLQGAGLIDAEEQRFYTALINQNKFWLGKNYYDIKVYFGLEEPTTTVPSTTETTTTSETTVTTSSEPTTLSTSSVLTTSESTTQPTTIPSTSPQPDPTTTPDSGNSIILSASLIFVTLMMQILRMF